MDNLYFEVEPLDINIAKVQFSLLKKFTLENLNFPVSESFENHDPILNFSDLKVTCYNNSDNLNLDVEVSDLKKEKKYLYTLKTGNKQDILDYLNNKIFLMGIKELVLKINNET